MPPVAMCLDNSSSQQPSPARKDLLRPSCSPEASRLGPRCDRPPIMVAANSETTEQGGSAISSGYSD
nr:hypothetical protein CFP56_45268 [Quercus suber]